MFTSYTSEVFSRYSDRISSSSDSGVDPAPRASVDAGVEPPRKGLVLERFIFKPNDK
jgi:hypothetical protein